MNKYKPEKYIIQRIGKNGWSFQVKYKDCACKTFSEEEYGSASFAFQKAKAYRNECMTGYVIKVRSSRTVREVFEETFDLFPLRAETVRKHYLWYDKYFGYTCPIADIEQADIITCLNSMIEDCSDDTIKRIFGVWKRIYQVAVIKGYVVRDLTVGITPPASRKICVKRIIPKTDKELIDTVCALCEKTIKNPHDRQMYPLLVRLIYWTGMRPCEAIALHRSDIFPSYISITKEVGSTATELKAIRQCKTDDSVRDIPITEEIREILDKAMELSSSEIIFSDRYGRLYDTTKIGDSLHQMCKRKGISFNMYAERHYFATDLITNKKADTRTVKELMGHASEITTVDYARSDNELKINAIKNRD